MDLACSPCKFGLDQKKKLSKHFAIKKEKNNNNSSLYLK